MLDTFSQLSQDMEEDIQGVTKWTDNIYNKYFSSFFHTQRHLYERMQSASRPITDSELEQILTELPLELFTVSESLSQFQISEEVVKLKFKEAEADKLNALSKEDPTLSDTKKKEQVAQTLLEHKLLIMIYSIVSGRVDKQISFSRELIMGCKKIWDRRKNTDSADPIGTSVDGSLPEYKPDINDKYYIK